jgi:hypothetical protein
MKPKLFYPESIFSIDQFSSSTLLYFENTLQTTLHPTVSIFLTGFDPMKFMTLLESSNYKFKEQFIHLFEIVQNSSVAISETSKIMQPLYEKKYMQSIWMVYPKNEIAFQKSEEIISKSNLTVNQIFDFIDPVMACHELVAHILFEKFLEFYSSSSSSQKDELQNNKNANKDNYKQLFEYCEKLFAKHSTKELLVKAYLFRFPTLDYVGDILVSNNRILPFLQSIKTEKSSESSKNYYETLDVISWEIFRQLTSKYLDQIDAKERIIKIIDFRTNFREEVEALRNKCLKLGEQFKGEKDMLTLEKNISMHVKINTEKEIRDLLKLNSKISENLIDSIFADEKTWLGISGFLGSILTGNAYFSATVGFAAITNIGAKVYKQVSDAEKKINESDYALIYRMRN